MNKNQKPIVISLLLIASFVWCFGYAQLNTNWWDNRTFPVNEVTPQYCENEKNIYLDEDNDEDGLADKWFFMNNNLYISTKPEAYSAASIWRNTTSGTRVLFFRPYSNMIYKLNSLWYPSPLDGSTFWRGSFVFPYQKAVRGIATNPNKIVLEQPHNNNTGQDTVGFVFLYKLFLATRFDGNTLEPSYQYHAIPDTSYYLDSLAVLTTLQPNTKRIFSPTVHTITGCMNIKIARCGDGKISTYQTGRRLLPFTGEVCDDGPLNGTPWYCNATCSGTGLDIGRCGDEIIQEPWTTPYIDPISWASDGMSFEECDDGDEEWDTDGLLNGDDPAQNFCSSICLPTFAEEFTEEFVDR